MELKDFIKGVISDIALATKELNEEYSNTGLLVNPANCHDIAKGLSETGDGRMVRDIEFNLVISASNTTNAGGGLKINVLRAGIDNEVNNSTISTIKFSVPVAFPGSEGPRRDFS